MFKHFTASACCVLALAASASAVDLESFFFNDANGTPLSAAINTANGGNQWSYSEEATTPGDDTTGDISTVQSGSYRVITNSAFATGLESRFLDIANVSSGRLYLTATFSNWSFGAFDGSTAEQVRFTFLDDDTGTSGSTVTAQVQIRRNTTTGAMELFGDSIGTAGSFDIANTVDLPDTQLGPFTVVLALDKDSDSFEVFYQDGSDPAQVLGLGGVSRVRNANSVRMVTNNFGVENFLPFVITEEANVDSIVLSDDNPFAGDLLTLEVNRVTGAMNLINNTSAAVTGVTSLTVESATGSIDAAELASFSGTLGVGQNVSLDAMPGTTEGPWIMTPTEDLRAELALSGGGVRTIDVDFVGNGGLKWVAGDLNFNGAIDAGDYSILTATAEADLSSLSIAEAYQAGDLNGDGFNDAIDFGIFKDAFIAANGPLAFANMIAGVPEPTAASLAGLGLLPFVLRRRRRRAGADSASASVPTMTSLETPARLAVIAAAALLFAPPRQAEAVIFEEFLFDDTAGTPITAAVNNANPGVFWDEDTDTIDVLTNGLGQLDASLKANTNFGTNYIDVEPELTTGTIFGVMELTWDFQSVLDPTENEQIRISLVNNDPRGTEITAEFRIERTDADQIIINGMAGGTGSSDLPDTLLNGGSLTQTDKFIAVVAADLDNSTYEILYSNNAGASFLSAGTGNSAPGRIVESMRMTLNNDLSGDNVLIDRVYLADALPIVIDPDELSLYVHPVSGYAAIVDDTGTTFDIDYYRIQSGDDSLLEANWNSLQDRGIDAVDGPDPGSTAGDGVGETWTEAGGSDAGVLSESFLLSSSTVDPDEVLPLGRVIDLAGDEQQLTFEYRDATTGNVFDGAVQVVELLAGDFNLDGRVDAADYTVFRDNASGLFSPADYTAWANNLGAVFSSSPSTSIPEPTTIALLAIVVGLGARRPPRP